MRRPEGEEAAGSRSSGAERSAAGPRSTTRLTVLWVTRRHISAAPR